MKFIIKIGDETFDMIGIPEEDLTFSGDYSQCYYCGAIENLKDMVIINLTKQSKAKVCTICERVNIING